TSAHRSDRLQRHEEAFASRAGDAGDAYSGGTAAEPADAHRPAVGKLTERRPLAEVAGAAAIRLMLIGDRISVRAVVNACLTIDHQAADVACALSSSEISQLMFLWTASRNGRRCRQPVAPAAWPSRRTSRT